MKNFCIAALLVLTAGFCLGQAPKPSVSVPDIEVFGGYLGTFPDFGPHWDTYRFNGFEGQFAKRITTHLWVVGSADFTFGHVSALDASVHQFTGTAGGKFNFLTGRVRPYGIGEFGYVHQSSSGPLGGIYAHDHVPNLPLNATDIESGPTYRGGGGVDLQMNSHLYWRLIQWDIQRMPFARHTPYYQNFSAGVGYRF